MKKIKVTVPCERGHVITLEEADIGYIEIVEGKIVDFLLRIPKFCPHCGGSVLTNIIKVVTRDDSLAENSSPEAPEEGR